MKLPIFLRILLIFTFIGCPPHATKPGKDQEPLWTGPDPSHVDVPVYLYSQNQVELNVKTPMPNAKWWNPVHFKTILAFLDGEGQIPELPWRVGAGLQKKERLWENFSTGSPKIPLTCL